MNNSLKDKAGISVDGHVLIKDIDTDEVILDKHNAINFENFSLALAGLLTNTFNSENSLSYGLHGLALGNGGTVIDAVGNITYRSPNVDEPTGVLYQETYRKTLGASDATSEVVRYPNETYSDVVTTITLDYDEPSDQLATDTATGDTETDYIFDELGLVTEEGSFLTHLIFHPVQKSANRKIQIIYTLRIKAGQ